MERSINQIRSGCEQFGLSGLSGVVPLSGGYANLNYRISTDQGDFFYRVCLQQSNVELIHWEIRLLQSLRRLDFPTAYMLVAINGDCLVDTDHGKILIYEFKKGYEPLLNANTVAEIGKSLARLNQFPDWQEFPRKNVINIDDCIGLIDQFKNAPIQYPGLFSYFEEQTVFLQEFVQDDLPRGIIHGDCFPDNTIFNKDRLVAIVDFEEACVDHLLMDVGMAINGFCFVNNQLDPKLLNVFLKNYNEIRSLTRIEWELLPYYVQWAGHGMISWHLRYFLISRRNDKQKKRVLELMDRVKTLRRTVFPVVGK